MDAKPLAPTIKTFSNSIMVMGGVVNGKPISENIIPDTQLVDLNNENDYGDVQFQNYPFQIFAHSGALVNDIPISCGGRNGNYPHGKNS